MDGISALNNIFRILSVFPSDVVMLFCLFVLNTQDLSSPEQGGTHVVCTGSFRVLTTELPGKDPAMLSYFTAVTWRRLRCFLCCCVLCKHGFRRSILTLTSAFQPTHDWKWLPGEKLASCWLQPGMPAVRPSRPHTVSFQKMFPTMTSELPR